jgi:hypothetical protein
MKKRKTPEEKITIAVDLAIKELAKEITLSNSTIILLKYFGKLCIYKHDKDVKLKDIELSSTVWSNELLSSHNFKVIPKE